MLSSEIDFHIGLDLSEDYRVARITPPPFFDLVKAIWYDPKIIWMLLNLAMSKDSPLIRAGSNPSWIQVSGQCTVNNPEQHAMEQAAALGIGNARSLAELFNLGFKVGIHLGYLKIPWKRYYRVARVTPPPFFDLVKAIWYDPKIIRMLLDLAMSKDSPLIRAGSNPSWIQVSGQCTVNNPEQHAMEQAAALGIGNARSLAELFNLVCINYG
ncbi:unnamed protein product [Strongylus vulgaris]|uniref:Uncharacterized protein n=1 Tax=Strongylus vulgaris TaxID=40348 RepID=A0A3P7JKC1_STRVU|nr:unnamed protein product [Strongylus vulgaris]